MLEKLAHGVALLLSGDRLVVEELEEACEERAVTGGGAGAEG